MSEVFYQRKKQELLRELQTLREEGRPWSLNKRTSNLFRPGSSARKDLRINLQQFHRVIRIDKENLLVDVEGLTTYEELVAETLKENLLPAVVPELKTITVGGAIAGCGIESSSFKYGLVHETVKEVDVLLSSGDAVTCSPDNLHRDLFYALPNTFGTLGYILRARLQLVPARQFVRLLHEKYADPELFFQRLSHVCGERAFDFIDGVVFSPDEMVVTLGKFTDYAPYVSSYERESIYYLSLKEKSEDFLTASGYIWRWDPDWFWCSRVFFMQNPWMRRLFGRWMLHSGSYAKVMHFFNRRPRLKRCLEFFYGQKESVIQDVSIPIENAKRFLDFFHQEIGIRPIWVCPTSSQEGSGSFDFCPLKEGRLYLDFGFWDSVATKEPPGHYNRLIEKMAMGLNGFKSLYSTSYYTEEEFWSIYDRQKYRALKIQYDPQGLLRGFFEKCTKKI